MERFGFERRTMPIEDYEDYETINLVGCKDDPYCEGFYDGDCAHCPINVNAVIKLSKYEDADEEGRIFISKYKIGDHVYFIDEDDNTIYGGVIKNTFPSCDYSINVDGFDGCWITYRYGQNTVFDTKEKAESEQSKRQTERGLRDPENTFDTEIPGHIFYSDYKIGEKVYEPYRSAWKNRKVEKVIEHTITDVTANGDVFLDGEHLGVKIGNDVFSTREEAEKVLEGWKTRDEQ